MTNAVGYYYNEREERINKDHPDYTINVQGRYKTDKNYSDSYDINRDFAYNQLSQNDCLNTIAGRVIH